jgi:alanine racemase
MDTLPTWVEIDLDAFIHNVDVIRSNLARNVKILLVVKADAYGHGAAHMVRTVEDRVDYFGVATIEEAVELSALGLRRPLLIMTPILGEEVAAVVDQQLCVNVGTVEMARALSQHASRRATRVEIHVEVDTGMGRTGILPAELPDLLDEIHTLPGVRLGGLWTHFPDADRDPDFTRKQLNELLALVEGARKKGIEIPLVHSANSAAMTTLPESHLDMVRPGLLLYGCRTSATSGVWPVRPVATWKCRVVQVREMPSGATVSYDRTYKTHRATTMAVLPVGYGHGYPVRLSNRAEVLVRGVRAPVIGRVTMDMTMVDVTGVSPPPSPGDEVVLMGEGITARALADWVGTIPYEIVTGISRRVPRLYIRAGKVESRRSILGASGESVDA